MFSLLRVCCLVYLLVIHNSAQNFGASTGVDASDCSERKTQTACENPQPKPFVCQWVNNACEVTPVPSLQACYMIDTSNSISASKFTILKNVLKTHMNDFQSNPWMGIVSYDSSVNVQRGVTPTNDVDSPASIIDSLTQNTLSSTSVGQAALDKCVSLLKGAVSITQASHQMIVTVAGRGQTDATGAQLCDRSTEGTSAKTIYDDYYKVMNFQVGNDVVGGNVDDFECLNKWTWPKGLVFHFTDVDFASNNVTIPYNYFSSLDGVSSIRRRLMRINHH